MNVVERYGRRNGNKQEPQMPAVPPPRPAPDDDYEARALASVQRLKDELVTLREENGRLRADLNLALMRCREAEKMQRDMSSDLEMYRRYAVEVKTHLGLVVEIAKKANNAAFDAARTPMPDDQAQEVIEQTERELRELAAGNEKTIS
jgi:hypothetical protein